MSRSRNAGKGPAVVIYRGQLEIERSRVEFLLDCALRAFGEVEIVHLYPGTGFPASRWDRYLAPRPGILRVQVLDARIRRAPAIRRQLSWVIREHRATLAIGFSAAAFLPEGRCDVWSINGIPEERLLSRDTALNRAAVAFSWALARKVGAGRIIAVSDAMAQLLSERLPRPQLTVAPNTVDADLFAATHGDPTWLTYQGGASPWQGLERLSLVWQALHRLDGSLRFRVISRDPRAQVLLHGMPDHVIEVVSSDAPEEVARWLAASRLGFLFREPTLVNEVACPMKFGEYLAAGSPVVVSRCGWDLEAIVEEFQVGLCVEWEDSPVTTAQEITRYLAQLDGRPVGVRGATAYLSSRRWIEEVANDIRQAARLDG